MDCTFCLDCVYACPHQNVGIMASLGVKELAQDPIRSGVGQFWKRRDLAFLVVVLLFGGLANASAMVGPVVKWQENLQSVIGSSSPLLITSLYYLLCMVILPLISLGGTTAISQSWGRLQWSWLDVATRFSYSLLPLGFSIWLAHYTFHFLGSYETVVPATQRFLADLGWSFSGKPAWALSCCQPVAGLLPRLEILSLDMGLLLSLYAGYRIALNGSSLYSLALRAFLPWGVLILILFAIGVWIVLQPMQMRGTMVGA
jgi:hypothetical protein